MWWKRCSRVRKRARGLGYEDEHNGQTRSMMMQFKKIAKGGTQLPTNAPLYEGRGREHYQAQSRKPLQVTSLPIASRQDATALASCEWVKAWALRCRQFRGGGLTCVNVIR
ncbi:unnamed protein product [Amoebophrya sp. A25]|nr:unnamed protein product [Amoebophrya sp. A25]|eukprot:GSA25T00023716001.1